MSESVHSKLFEAQERNEQAQRGHKLVPLAAAIIAVLAALGTLFSHHRSIMAITVKNEAILAQLRATERYNAYETKRIRYHVYTALVAAGIVQTGHGRDALQKIADKEQQGSLKALADAEELEKEAGDRAEESERILTSYETLEIGTTFFEISIVLVSISALTRTPIFLTLGAGLSAVGIAFIVVGYFQGH